MCVCVCFFFWNSFKATYRDTDGGGVTTDTSKDGCNQPIVCANSCFWSILSIYIYIIPRLQNLVFRLGSLWAALWYSGVCVCICVSLSPHPSLLVILSFVMSCWRGWESRNKGYSSSLVFIITKICSFFKTFYRLTKLPSFKKLSMSQCTALTFEY